MRTMIWFVCVLVSVSFLTGCRSYMMQHVNTSMRVGNYEQAAERLRRCAEKSPDKQICEEKIKSIKDSGLDVGEYLHREDENLQQKAKREAFLQELADMRESNDPWVKHNLAMEIQRGNIEEIYSGEKDALLKEAFDDFGLCAEEADPDCMTQYAKMILNQNNIDVHEMEDSEGKALYWLNLSARYGNNEARKVLLNLGKGIPSPDLSTGLHGQKKSGFKEEIIKQNKTSTSDRRRRGRSNGVIITTHEYVNGCRSLGEVEGSSGIKGIEKTKRVVKQRAARQGATHIVWLTSEASFSMWSMWGQRTYVSAMAYKCDEN